MVMVAVLLSPDQQAPDCFARCRVLHLQALPRASGAVFDKWLGAVHRGAQNLVQFLDKASLAVLRRGARRPVLVTRKTLLMGGGVF